MAMAVDAKVYELAHVTAMQIDECRDIVRKGNTNT